MAAGLLAHGLPHAALNHLTGNEISSSDNSAVEEPRDRRGLVSRLTYQIIFYCAKLVTLI